MCPASCDLFTRYSGESFQRVLPLLNLTSHT